MGVCVSPPSTNGCTHGSPAQTTRHSLILGSGGGGVGSGCVCASVRVQLFCLQTSSRLMIRSLPKFLDLPFRGLEDELRPGIAAIFGRTTRPGEIGLAGTTNEILWISRSGSALPARHRIGKGWIVCHERPPGRAHSSCRPCEYRRAARISWSDRTQRSPRQCSVAG